MEDLPIQLQQLVQKLHQTEDNQRKYEYLIWLGKKLPPFPDTNKIPEYKVPGCVSQVYVIAKLTNGKVNFAGDADAHITKGLLALLIKGLNDLSPQEIIELNPTFIKMTGLDVSLTPSRSNGFYNIFKTMQNQVKQLTVSF